MDMWPIRPTHACLATHCGVMSLRGGNVLVALFWMGFNVYQAVLAFQGYSPFFSYLPHAALIVQGVVCVMFTVASTFALIALYFERSTPLTYAHRFIWIMIILYLVDMTVNLAVFGEQNQQFQNWCISNARQTITDNAALQIGSSSDNGSRISFSAKQPLEDTYNCMRLWQVEVKMTTVALFLMLVCYIYWGALLWSISQRQQAIEVNIFMNQPAPQYMQTMMNLGKDGHAPSSVHNSNDNEKSLAQLFDGWMNQFKHRIRRQQALP